MKRQHDGLWFVVTDLDYDDEEEQRRALDEMIAAHERREITLGATYDLCRNGESYTKATACMVDSAAGKVRFKVRPSTPRPFYVGQRFEIRIDGSPKPYASGVVRGMDKGGTVTLEVTP